MDLRKHIRHGGRIAALWLLMATPPGALAAISQVPLFVGSGETLPPLVMLALSNDHQLYFKAYNDYSDLDGDGDVETTYEDAIDYYGYFDSNRCYTYSAGVFSAGSAAGGANGHYCNAAWSGNFLNWATMARMDVVRKLLYGGLRSTDTSSSTVLERVYLPNDSHSWAKHYAGADVSLLTPFSGVRTTAPVGRSTSAVDLTDPPLASNRTLTVEAPGGTTDTRDWIEYGDQLVLEAVSDLGGDATLGTGDDVLLGVTLVGVMLNHNPPANGEITLHVLEARGVDAIGETEWSQWRIRNPTRVGLTLCNTTVATGFSDQVDTSTHPPLARVAEGDYSLWAANERWQCRWWDEQHTTGFEAIGGVDLSNGSTLTRSGLPANSDNPDEEAVALGNGDYNVRVSACAGGTRESNCKEYPDGNFKPTGLLQRFGDNDLIHFGLITGSYDRNKSGGLLRKNVAPFSTEIDTDNGRFVASTGIVATLDMLRLYGYDHSVGTYNSRDNCGFQLSSFSNGNCSNWGNPFSEIYLEALNYFSDAANGPTTAFDGDDTAYIPGLTDATWTDPLNARNYCSSLDIVALNASAVSYDDDELNLGRLATTAASAAALTDVVGAGEGINGGQFFVGEAGVSGNQLCTAKTLGSLGDARGVCPETPRLSGTYHVAGLAHFAKTEDIRPGYGIAPHEDQTVTTYGVELATALPQVTIEFPGRAEPVTLVPACQNTDVGNCAIVDFKIVERTTTSGTFFILWEDSEQGGDFDQDMAGVLSYQVAGSGDSAQLAVTTRTFGDSTSGVMGFGYVLSGTTADGFHAHSGIGNYNYTDPTGVTGCTDCAVNAPPTSATYAVGESAADFLRSPLYYASKWGGFQDVDAGTVDGAPDVAAEWDRDADGLPNNYFFAVDPQKLEDSLESVFGTIIEQASSSAPVGTNTGIATETDTKVYQPIFITQLWYGRLLSIPLGAAGALPVDATGTVTEAGIQWDAGRVLGERATPATTRSIITTDATGAGIPFRWASLDAGQQALLNTNPDTGAGDGLGSDRVDFLRGDVSTEIRNGGGFRNRPVVAGVPRLLGDVINSAPAFVGAPPFQFNRFLGAPEAGSYLSFANSNASRQEMVYVGANDGMVHGFAAETGAEELAFVPSMLMPNLPELTSPSYTHRYYVDGSPRMMDAWLGATPGWRTVLVGGLNGGGQGIYALDVTNPALFSEANADDLVLWEFDDVDDPATATVVDGHRDLGFTFSRPAVVRMHNGRWMVVVGSGYDNRADDDGDGTTDNDSTTGDGKIFFIDLATGNLERTITLPFSAVSGLPNYRGVSSVATADVDGDLIVDFVYAGDTLGELWKIDVTDTLSSNWASAFGTEATPVPLFRAVNAGGVRQPITSAPAVRNHPTNQGQLLAFGTGKYFETADGTVDAIEPTQSLYAVWDTGLSETPPVLRGDLVEQSVLAEVTVAGGDRVRVTSDNPITWFDGSGNPVDRGWFMDLPTNGERIVSRIVLRDNRLLASTVIPLDDPCQFGGTGFLMELDVRDGGPLPFPVFDLNDDGLFNLEDTIELLMDIDGDGTEETVHVPPSGKRSLVGIPSPPTPFACQDCPGGELKVLSGSSGGLEGINNNTGTRRREVWREVR